MDLYGFWRSAAAYRVRVALNFKGIPVHEIPVDLDKGEQRDPAFLAVNPQGALPALVEPGEAPLTQSLAILEYLEEVHPEPPLLPKDPRGRARVRSLAAVIAADSHPLVVPRVRHYLMDHEGFDAVRWRAWQTQWFGAGLRTLETRLADGQAGRFCHGDTPTFADLCLMSCVTGVRNFKLDVGSLPRIDRIAEACMAMEAFARADPTRQLDFPTAA
jgi:maleylacetoacetate isomerase